MRTSYYAAMQPLEAIKGGPFHRTTTGLVSEIQDSDMEQDLDEPLLPEDDPWHLDRRRKQELPMLSHRDSDERQLCRRQTRWSLVEWRDDRQRKKELTKFRWELYQRTATGDPFLRLPPEMLLEVMARIDYVDIPQLQRSGLEIGKFFDANPNRCLSAIARAQYPHWVAAFGDDRARTKEQKDALKYVLGFIEPSAWFRFTVRNIPRLQALKTFFGMIENDNLHISEVVEILHMLEKRLETDRKCLRDTKQVDVSKAAMVFLHRLSHRRVYLNDKYGTLGGYVCWDSHEGLLAREKDWVLSEVGRTNQRLIAVTSTNLLLAGQGSNDSDERHDVFAKYSPEHKLKFESIAAWVDSSVLMCAMIHDAFTDSLQLRSSPRNSDYPVSRTPTLADTVEEECHGIVRVGLQQAGLLDRTHGGIVSLLQTCGVDIRSTVSIQALESFKRYHL